MFPLVPNQISQMTVRRRQTVQAHSLELCMESQAWYVSQELSTYATRNKFLIYTFDSWKYMAVRIN